MSLLTDFNSSAYSIAKEIIGPTLFVIGSGKPVDVIPAEARHNRESEFNGFQKTASLTVVSILEDFREVYTETVENYLGKNCTHKGEPWRIGDIEEGEGYVRISLVSRTEVA